MNVCDRRQFLGTSLMAMGASILGPRLSWGQELAGAVGKRNVLFVAVDDLRPLLGCYGRSQMHTPNFDALGARGMVFQRAYCQMAVCGASRTSLLTGLRPDAFNGQAFPQTSRVLPDTVTLPQHFRSHGYHTVSIGKIYHHEQDDLKGWSDPPWRNRRNWPGYIHVGVRSDPAGAAGEGAGGGAQRIRGPAFECADAPNEEFYDSENATRAMEAMHRLKDRRFFIGLGFQKPHLPFVAPKKYWDLYDPAGIDLADNPFKPKDAPDMALHNWGELRGYEGVPRTGPVSDELARQLIHGYYACTSFVDAQLGRVLAELRNLGLEENTLVVVWGDHGFHLGDHGLWCKHSNFETAVHSPLIVAGAGIAPPTHTSQALVEFVDIYPSLCELTGLETPAHVEGHSFVPLLDRPDRPWKSGAFSQYPRGAAMGYTVRTDRYRYTEWRRRADGQVDARELYDHQIDPGENANRVEDPAYAGAVTRSAALLEAGYRAALPAAAV